MGKKLDALLGRRRFKTSKFKATVSLAISRLSVLKNQRQARCSIATSDVLQFLNTNNHDRALLRVEQVIKEQNMLDVFNVLEGYCNLLLERINLLEQERVCPEELNEAVATLIYASTRCGEFPELQELRAIFTSRFGREFAARAVELRNNCGVNPKIIQKLSTRMPSLENKMKLLKEIATDNNVDFQMEETLSDTTVENMDSGQQKPGTFAASVVSNQGENESIPRRKYKDVADAAQEAFESAAYAAAAARAAVELSRFHPIDPDDSNTPSPRPRKVSSTIDPTKADLHKNPLEDQHMKPEAQLDKIHYALETREGTLDSLDVDNVNDQEGKIKQRNIVYDESDEDDEQRSLDEVYDDHENRFGLEREKGPGNYHAQFDEEKRTEEKEPLNINRRPISVRTRWTQGR